MADGSTPILPDAGFWVDSFGPKLGGVVVFVLILMGYHRQLLGLFNRMGRDPVADAVIAGMAAQTEQFKGNNGLFQSVVALLGNMVSLLTELRDLTREGNRKTDDLIKAIGDLHLEIVRQGGKS